MAQPATDWQGRFPPNQIISLLDVNRPFNLAESTVADLRFGELLNLVGVDDFLDLSLGYGSAAGSKDLREAVGEMLSISPDQVLTTNGVQGALALLALEASSYSIAEATAPMVDRQNLAEAQDMGSPAAPDYSIKPKKKSSTAKKLAIGAGIVLGVALVGVLGWGATSPIAAATGGARKTKLQAVMGMWLGCAATRSSQRVTAGYRLRSKPPSSATCVYA